MKKFNLVKILLGFTLVAFFDPSVSAGIFMATPDCASLLLRITPGDRLILQPREDEIALAKKVVLAMNGGLGWLDPVFDFAISPADSVFRASYHALRTARITMYQFSTIVQLHLRQICAPRGSTIIEDFALNPGAYSFDVLKKS